MLTVEIQTSRRGRLWASSYWKTLFDAMCRNGAKQDPRRVYPDLAPNLRKLVVERGGRFHPSGKSLLAERDDVAVQVIRVRRVTHGHEGVCVRESAPPEVSGWRQVDVAFFGTIGDSKYEAQMKLNRAALEQVFQPICSPVELWLGFRLSTDRRDRDLDNLADALMPFFNRWAPRIEDLRLVKLTPRLTEHETLWFSCVSQQKPTRSLARRMLSQRRDSVE